MKVVHLMQVSWSHALTVQKVPEGLLGAADKGVGLVLGLTETALAHEALRRLRDGQATSGPGWSDHWDVMNGGLLHASDRGRGTRHGGRPLTSGHQFHSLDRCWWDTFW